jgi:steroid delta-isomerase-like uncharacterized protein
VETYEAGLGNTGAEGHRTGETMSTQDSSQRHLGAANGADALAVAERYFDAWQRRDPDAILGTFAEGGTYADPTAGTDLTGPAIAAYAVGLFAAFPDLSFEIVSVGPAGDGRVVVEWLMRGTNTGPMAGNPPSGRAAALPGVDLIAVEGDRVRSVRGYFDRNTLLEQLGLQILVQPHAVGPFSFGSSVHAGTGRRTRPGAVSLTAIHVQSDAEAAEVQTYSRKIIAELLETPGFIGFLGGVVGRTLYTVTAWEDPDSPGQLRAGGTHRDAMRRFFGPDFARAGVTSVWAPDRLNTMWVRCAACGVMADSAAPAGRCACGEPLPEPPPYW